MNASEALYYLDNKMGYFNVTAKHVHGSAPGTSPALCLSPATTMPFILHLP